jgi:hypothetical protein
MKDETLPPALAGQVERRVRPLALLLACLLAACGDASPMQGTGALWLHERGMVRCVNVQRITFVASRWVRYVEAGETKETGVPLDYRRGETCPAA